MNRIALQLQQLSRVRHGRAGSASCAPEKEIALYLRHFARLGVPFLLISSASFVGACSSSESDAGGDGDGDGNASTGGDSGNPGTGGSDNPPGSGGNGDPGNSGGTSGSGGASGETGGASPGDGGADGAGGNESGSDGGSPGAGGGENTTTCATPEEDLFSFFATSHAALIRESGNPDGFGGDLGGLAGADAICQSIAEFSSPCQANKTWRAFLSTSTEDAIDRIGTGPWHDRLGRLLANNIDELLDPSGRPTNAHAEIKDDFPNEDGVPNQYPDGEHVDNHQFITGSGLDGRVYAVNDGAGSMCNDEFSVAAATCNDWTTSEPVGCPRVGHSWPRELSGIHWISVWNESGCAPGGVLSDSGGFPMEGDRKIGSYGGYGGFYCFAVTGQ